MRTATNAPAPDAIAVEQLSCAYANSRAVVDQLNLNVAPGEILGLLGPSGCGKTTTLRMLAGLQAPTSGSIRIHGRDVTQLAAWQRNIGFVLQNYALFPHLSVADNIAYGLRLRKQPSRQIARRVEQMLALVRLDGLGGRMPAALSGGQQQRVAMARALAIEPDILLLDEPLSNLDAQLRIEMRNEIRDLQRKTGVTTVIVTHDQEEALTLCDRIGVLHEGRLAQLGAPSMVYDNPASKFVASFIGRANMLPAQVVAVDGQVRLRAGGVLLPGRPAQPAGTDVTVMIRPHLVTLDVVKPAGETRLVGRVTRRSFNGNSIDVHVVCSVGSLSVELRPHTALANLAELEAVVALDWSAEDVRILTS